MSSQILITGATGFIGRQLTRDLVAQGGAVRILARDRRKARALFGKTVEIVPGGLEDEAALLEAVRDAETIYHVAGSYRFGLRHRRELWRTNVEGTENLLRSAAKSGAARIVHLSSGGVLGKPRGRAGLLEENDFPSTAPRWCAYKASKWEAERRVLAWARRGLPVTIASTTGPIGGGDEAPTPTGRIILDFLQGKFPFFCRTGLNFIGLGDLSRGLQRVAERGRPGERYLLSDRNLWLEEFLQLLARETGLNAPGICLPGALVHVLGAAGELADFFRSGRGNTRVCLETALQSGRLQFFSNAKAREELGWKPQVPIEKSVAEAVAWFSPEPEPVSEPAAPLESHVQ
jgi:dihydroflavonol-4-reductase